MCIVGTQDAVNAGQQDDDLLWSRQQVPGTPLPVDEFGLRVDMLEADPDERAVSRAANDLPGTER